MNRLGSCSFFLSFSLSLSFWGSELGMGMGWEWRCIWEVLFLLVFISHTWLGKTGTRSIGMGRFFVSSHL